MEMLIKLKGSEKEIEKALEKLDDIIEWEVPENKTYNKSDFEALL